MQEKRRKRECLLTAKVSRYFRYRLDENKMREVRVNTFSENDEKTNESASKRSREDQK